MQTKPQWTHPSPPREGFLKPRPVGVDPYSRFLYLPECGCPCIARQPGYLRACAPQVAYDLDEFIQADLQGVRVAEKSCRGSGDPRPEYVNVLLHLRGSAGREDWFPEGWVNAAEATSVPVAAACQADEHTVPFAWGTNDQGLRLFTISFHLELSS